MTYETKAGHNYQGDLDDMGEPRGGVVRASRITFGLVLFAVVMCVTALLIALAVTYQALRRERDANDELDMRARALQIETSCRGRAAQDADVALMAKAAALGRLVLAISDGTDQRPAYAELSEAVKKLDAARALREKTDQECATDGVPVGAGQ